MFGQIRRYGPRLILLVGGTDSKKTERVYRPQAASDNVVHSRSALRSFYARASEFESGPPGSKLEGTEKLEILVFGSR
jgi:hypothetical protein